MLSLCLFWLPWSCSDRNLGHRARGVRFHRSWNTRSGYIGDSSILAPLDASTRFRSLSCIRSNSDALALSLLDVDALSSLDVRCLLACRHLVRPQMVIHFWRRDTVEPLASSAQSVVKQIFRSFAHLQSLLLITLVELVQLFQIPLQVLGSDSLFVIHGGSRSVVMNALVGLVLQRAIEPR